MCVRFILKNFIFNFYLYTLQKFYTRKVIITPKMRVVSFNRWYVGHNCGRQVNLPHSFSKKKKRLIYLTDPKNMWREGNKGLFKVGFIWYKILEYFHTYLDCEFQFCHRGVEPLTKSWTSVRANLLFFFLRQTQNI